MPRLDNSSEEILAVLSRAGYDGPFWCKQVYDPKDPGAMPPIDVCTMCARMVFDDREEGNDPEHLPYEEGDTRFCAICGYELVEEDN